MAKGSRVARTYRLPADLAEALRVRARAEDDTETAVLRRALEAYLMPENAPVTRSDLVRFFAEIQSSIEAVKAEALPAPDEAKAKKDRGFFRRLFGGRGKEA